jgi:hypothetical protein
VTTKYLAKFQSPTAVIWPKIIQPERHQKSLVVTTIWDIDLIFGMRVYNHKLQINFEICSGWMIFGQLTAVGIWNLAKYLVGHHFISLEFEILTWFLVWECIIISYRSTLKFVPVEWLLAKLQPLGFEIWPNI